MKTNRRTFLSTAACGVGALGFGWEGSEVEAADSSASSETCGLAIGTYGLQSMSVIEAIQLVARTGYNAVEITVFPGTTGDRSGALISKESRQEVRKVLEDSGVRLCALMADLKPEQDDKKHYASLAEINGLIQLANDLAPDDPPLIQTILGGKKWEESKNMFRDRLANWNQILADQKGHLSIKPHRSHAMSTPAEAVWLLEQLGNPPRLRMVYDYSHYAFHQPPLTIAGTVAEALPITNYVAVKDAVEAEGKVRFALAGESDNWDHADIIRDLFAGGYRGDFCCEVSSQIWRNNPSYDPVEATQRCYRNMVEAFERADVSRA